MNGHLFEGISCAFDVAIAANEHGWFLGNRNENHEHSLHLNWIQIPIAAVEHLAEHGKLECDHFSWRTKQHHDDKWPEHQRNFGHQKNGIGRLLRLWWNQRIIKIDCLCGFLIGILNQLNFKHDHRRANGQNGPPKEWCNDVLVDGIVFADKTFWSEEKTNQMLKRMQKLINFDILLNCLASEYIWMMEQKRCFVVGLSGVDCLVQSSKGKSVVISLAMQTNSQHEQMKNAIDVTPEMIAA